jgi:hypothetical protein
MNPDQERAVGGSCLGGVGGAILGLLLGGLLGWFWGEQRDAAHRGTPLGFLDGCGAFIGICLGAPIGAVVGAIVGAVFGASKAAKGSSSASSLHETGRQLPTDSTESSDEAREREIAQLKERLKQLEAGPEKKGEEQ